MANRLTVKEKLTELRKFLSDERIKYDEQELQTYIHKIYEIYEANKDDKDIGLVFQNLSTIVDWISFSAESNARLLPQEIYRGVRAKIMSDQVKLNRLLIQKSKLDSRRC